MRVFKDYNLNDLARWLLDEYAMTLCAFVISGNWKL